MTTEEVATRLVHLCREGKYEELYQELYTPDIVAIEPKGSPFDEQVKGLEAIYKKGEQWMQMVEEVVTSEISDPIVAENFFSITMKTKVKMKNVEEPVDMDEVCVYKVDNGKVVLEQFFYTPQN